MNQLPQTTRHIIRYQNKIIFSSLVFNRSVNIRLVLSKTEHHMKNNIKMDNCLI